MRSRRAFLAEIAAFTGVAALGRLPAVLVEQGWPAVAPAAAADLLHDTFNGLVAFVVPGPDVYSVAQGVSTLEPGGIDANVTDALVNTLDGLLPFTPQFSGTVAGILNGVAEQVNAAAGGTFPSPFACLRFAEKVAVFQVMESLDTVKPIAGFLPAVVAFLAYSEAGLFDPATRTLRATPVGWTTSGYAGVADGRDDFKGYVQNRRQVD